MSRYMKRARTKPNIAPWYWLAVVVSDTSRHLLQRWWKVAGCNLCWTRKRGMFYAILYTTLLRKSWVNDWVAPMIVPRLVSWCSNTLESPSHFPGSGHREEKRHSWRGVISKRIATSGIQAICMKIDMRPKVMMMNVQNASDVVLPTITKTWTFLYLLTEALVAFKAKLMILRMVSKKDNYHVWLPFEA